MNLKFRENCISLKYDHRYLSVLRNIKVLKDRCHLSLVEKKMFEI